MQWLKMSLNGFANGSTTYLYHANTDLIMTMRLTWVQLLINSLLDIILFLTVAPEVFLSNKCIGHCSKSTLIPLTFWGFFNVKCFIT